MSKPVRDFKGVPEGFEGEARATRPGDPAGSSISRRSAMKALFAMAASAVLFGNPVRARAADATQETKDALANAQAEFDRAQKQMDDLSNQFQALSEQQDKTIGQIEDTQGKIDDTQARIDDTQAAIDKKQAELEKKQDALSSRVSSAYKSGGHDTLALLLSSATLDELISNTYYLNKVNESDQKAIEEVNRIQKQLQQQKEQLQQQKQQLENQKKQLEDLRAKQADELEQMKAKKDEVQKLIDGLSQSVKDLIAKRDAEILAAAQAEEEARRAAAAAAAAAAARRSGGVTGSGNQIVAGADAQQRVVNSCHVTPSPGLGLCAKWVSQVFQNAGLGFIGGNADDMYSSWCTSSNKGALRVGMIIAVSSHPHTAAGRIYGHVGVYVGGNTVMDNVGYIRTIGLDEWISYYGPTVTPRWGWASGINLEG